LRDIRRALFLRLPVLAIGLHPPGGTPVVQVELQQPLQLHAKQRILHRYNGFHTAIQVAGHPIGTADVHLCRAVVGEPEQP
jgi:hypothetical protein